MNLNAAVRYDVNLNLKQIIQGMIPLGELIITEEMIAAAVKVLREDDLLFGDAVTKFEHEFANYCGVDHAITVGSGTDALIFSLLAVGIKGKHVITTPMSYIATANAAFHAGGKPIFCDVDEHTNNLDANLVEAYLKKDKKVGAIIPVHLHGYPADMNRFMEIAEKKDIVIIEDACQAHGAEYFKKKTGAIGHIGCFSLNPMKNMTCGGEGGMITTNDEKIAKIVRMLVDSGRENPYTHEHKIIGFSSRINTVNAAIGRIQLKYNDQWNEMRRNAANEYRKQLNGIKEIALPPEETQNITSAYNKFAIKTTKRKQLQDYMTTKDIQCDAHYPNPIHLQPPYKKLGYKKGDYQLAEKFADTNLAIPIFPHITKREIDEVCSAIYEFFA